MTCRVQLDLPAVAEDEQEQPAGEVTALPGLTAEGDPIEDSEDVDASLTGS